MRQEYRTLPIQIIYHKPIIHYIQPIVSSKTTEPVKSWKKNSHAQTSHS